MAPSTNSHLKHADMNNVRDYAADRSLKSSDAFYTTANGVRVAHAYETQRAGENGPLLLQDFHLIDLLSHFDRERIPERVVHAKGAGAHGFFECTNPLTEFCKSDIFSSAGKTCPIDVRFSTVGGESGSHDCARDPRGFSVNLHTDEGAWSWVFNNTPVFFLRDPAKFPHFIHTQKRAPDSHLTHADDSTVFWDYLSQNPESVHQVMILFGDRGIPDGYRHMNGYSGHTFKLVNDDNEWVYCQIHLKSNQGVKFITQEDSANYSPDYSTKDLFNAINEGNFPSWTVSVQTMTAKEAEEVWADGINVFDLTHVWPQGRFPLREVGKITLNENPVNYFAEVEQIAFNPAHLIPGIVASNDPVLQSRLFSYPDAHRHRLGVNYMQLPINAPKVPYPMANFQRDGQMAFFNQGARPNYISSIDPIKFEHEKADDLDAVHGHFVGNAVRFLSEIRPEDFNAPRILWQKVFDDGAKERFINNVSGHMSTCTKPEILRRQLAIFHQVSPDIAQRLSKAIDIKDYETDFSKLSFNGEHNGFATKDHLKAANGQARLPRPKDNGAPIKGSHGSRGTINKTPTANGNGVNGHTNGVNGH